MPDYTHTGTIDAPADVVFSYLADVRHLPRYLPRMTKAEPQPDGTVEMASFIHGVEQTVPATFEADAESRRISWGSPGNPAYYGAMQVADDGGTSVVTLNLTSPLPHDLAPYLEQSLAAIRDEIGTR